MSKDKINRLLQQLEEFTKTELHSSIVATLNHDLAVLEETLRDFIVIEPKDIAHHNQLHGRRAQLLSDLTVFTDAKDRLEAELDKIIESETESPTTR